MCSMNDHPPYDHKEDTDDVGDETIEERCPHCGRLFFHMTDCPNFPGNVIVSDLDPEQGWISPEILDRASDPEC